MAINQVENPPEHAHSAPAGEIRQEPRPMLVRFTWIIGLALLVPILALIIEGIRTNHFNLVAIGGILILILGIVFLLLLWRMITSRKVQKRRLR